MSDQSAYVRDFLKANDKDRYFATLFLPSDIQLSVQSLCAFAADISQIRARVTEPAAGEIRMQWWHDFLEGTEHGSAAANPLAAELQKTIDRFDLPTTPLRRLIAAHRFDLYDDPMRDMNSFEGYAGETNAIIYQFSCMMINGGNDSGTADISGHMGVAQSFIDQLYALPITSGRAQIVLPVDVFQSFGVTQQSIFAQQATDEMIEVSAKFRADALEHLSKVKTLLQETPAQYKPVFVHLSNLQARLDRLELFSNLPFAPPPDDADWKRLARMAFWMFKNAR